MIIKNNASDHTKKAFFFKFKIVKIMFFFDERAQDSRR